MFALSYKPVLKCLRYSLLQRNEERGCHILKRIFFKGKHRIPKEFNVAEFKVVYFLPSIGLISAIKRLKYMKLAVGAGLIPWSLYQYHKEEISFLHCIAGILLGCCVIMIMLYFILISRNLIGKIYVHTQKDQRQVVFSYIDPKGKRVSKIFHYEDIKVSDHPSLLCKKILKKITLKQDELELNLYYNRGIVIDFIPFMNVFPNLGEI